MTRLAVAAAAFLAFSSVFVWTQEASALLPAKRLCVQQQRKTLTNTLKFCKASATNNYAQGLRACFNDPGTGCVSGCQAVQSTCQFGPDSAHPGPAALKDRCANSQADDSFTSCIEKFDTDIDACGEIPCNCAQPLCTPAEFDACAATQLACTHDRRLDRFSCSQSCAAQYAPALDTCTQQFNDCIERCG